MRTIALETERLLLVEPSLDDVDDLVALNADPEVVRYTPEPHPSTPKRTRDFVLPRWQAFIDQGHGFGYWIAREKTTDRFLGWFHFRPCRDEPDNLQRIELGYRLRRDAWGFGYATEASNALIQRGFDQQGVQTVLAHALVGNKASARVMEKCGMRFIKHYIESVENHGDLECVQYAITKAEYDGLHA